ncbi:MAG: ATP synthase F0 subunit B [Oscillospiraceae bacterium]|nr:ATP synthase F0 subunit B [Oscillospiraceae bacterium]
MLRIDINLLFTVVNVLVLCLAVRIFLWKPIHKILDERQAQVEQDYTAAAEAKTQAEALVQEHQAKLAHIDEEREAALEAASQAAHEESAQIISDARSQATSILRSAQAQAQSEKEAILRSAQSEITDIIVAATAKMVGVQVGRTGDSELYDAFLEKAGDDKDE